MGKTKTAFVGGVTEAEMSGKDKYALKMKKKAEAEGKKDYGSPTTDDGKTREIKKADGLQTKDYRKTEKGITEDAEGKITKSTITEGTQAEVDRLQTTEEAEKQTTKKIKIAKIRGKKYKTARAKVDRSKNYPIAEAIKLIRATNITKFDATVELHITTKKAGLTANVTLPHSFGKTKKIEVATDETVKKLAGGKVDFDVLLATADMMPKLVPFARLLGPRGLMPNPKNGTIIKSEADANKFSSDSMNLKTQKDTSVIHTVAGKLSMKDVDIEANIKAIIEAISGKMIEKIYLKSTMSPSVKISY
jgi:large subunit ribosomal protein L1